MNKLLVIILLIICLSLFIVQNNHMPTSAQPPDENPITDDAKETILESITTYYEPNHNRLLECREDPVFIENQTAVVVDVCGTVSNGTYPLDTFAFSPSLGSMFYFSYAGNEFVKVNGTPCFVYADSANEKYRVESVGMTNTYISGDFVPDCVRVIDLTDGGIKWSTAGISNPLFWWSSDSRYLVIQGSGHKWTEIFVVDTASWSEVFRTQINDVFDISGAQLSANNNGLFSFLFNKWAGEHLFQVDFEIDLIGGSCAVGSFVYDLDTASYVNITVEEIFVG